MAEKDIAEKTFIALNDVFADIFNGLIFDGKQIITEDSLEDVIATSQYKADDEKLHEQERDTCKLWHGHGFKLVLLGIENQTAPDKDMPFRVIGYDGAAYRSQLLKKTVSPDDDASKDFVSNKLTANEPAPKENTTGELVSNRIESKEYISKDLTAGEFKTKERYPVITIVLYFGKEPWNAPVNLTECFHPKLPDNEITEILKKYIQDYKINVFDIPRLSMGEVRKFKSDFRVVAEYFVNVYNNPTYVADEVVIAHVDEFLKLMKALTGDNRYNEIALSLTKSEKEVGLTMCKVLDFREARGRAEGRAEGIAEGGLIMLAKLVKDEVIEICAAAERANMTEEEFETFMRTV